MKRALHLLGLTVFLASCSHGAPEEAPAPATPQAARVAIATVQTRDGKVTLLGGGPELRVMFRDMNGKVVMADASLDELRTLDPAAWMIVTRAVASGDKQGTYLDATLSHESPVGGIH